ncbi:MAG: DegT/DnrJ/EryC1/StrS family aminotransferase [Oscillospiraceae bacterium]|nr:DegT/DnrJ/EryC1/StrS family aminotransferase [Oscillospiraceae bacterium]
MGTPIHDFLQSYAASGVERCHMPGHGGLSNPLDITEVSAEAIDVIRESERNAARLFKAKRTLFSVSGATLAVFAMISPFAGRRITAYRNAHRSLCDAAILLDIGIDWIHTGETPESRINCETAAIFATNIDYYGNMADIPAIAEVCRRHKIPLLTDNAHGAYLIFNDTHPIQLGAAMSADSAHKTLPALTGAAYLHIADLSYAAQAESGIALFGSTSPSYLILDSLDLCNLHISEQKSSAVEAFEAVKELKNRLSEAGYSLRQTDRLRITVEVNDYGYYGDDFASALQKFGIVCEMFSPQHVILMFSTVTKKENTQRVFEAFRCIKKRPSVIPAITESLAIFKTVRPKSVMSLREAFFSPKKTIPLSEAAEKICAGICVTNPPCVPLIIPGEVISSEVINVLNDTGMRKIEVVTS